MAPTSPPSALLAACLFAALNACASPERPERTDPAPRAEPGARMVPRRPPGPQLTLEQIQRLPPFPRFSFDSTQDIWGGDSSPSPQLAEFFSQVADTTPLPLAIEFIAPTEVFDDVDWFLNAWLCGPDYGLDVYSWGPYHQLEVFGVEWDCALRMLSPTLVCILDMDDLAGRRIATERIDSAGIPSLWREGLRWACLYVPAPALRAASGLLGRHPELDPIAWGRLEAHPPDDPRRSGYWRRILARDADELARALVDWPNPRVFPGEAEAVEIALDEALWVELAQNRDMELELNVGLLEFDRVGGSYDFIGSHNDAGELEIYHFIEASRTNEDLTVRAWLDDLSPMAGVLWRNGIPRNEGGSNTWWLLVPWRFLELARERCVLEGVPELLRGDDDEWP